jgi:hypothetical protein
MTLFRDMTLSSVPFDSAQGTGLRSGKGTPLRERDSAQGIIT